MKISTTEVKGNNIVVGIRAETDFEKHVIGRGLRLSFDGNPKKSMSGSELRLVYADYRGKTIYNTRYGGEASKDDARSVAKQALQEFTRKMAS